MLKLALVFALTLFSPLALGAPEALTTQLQLAFSDPNSINHMEISLGLKEGTSVEMIAEDFHAAGLQTGNITFIIRAKDGKLVPFIDLRNPTSSELEKIHDFLKESSQITSTNLTEYRINFVFDFLYESLNQVYRRAARDTLWVGYRVDESLIDALSRLSIDQHPVTLSVELWNLGKYTHSEMQRLLNAIHDLQIEKARMVFRPATQTYEIEINVANATERNELISEFEQAFRIATGRQNNASPSDSFRSAPFLHVKHIYLVSANAGCRTILAPQSQLISDSTKK